MLEAKNYVRHSYATESSLKSKRRHDNINNLNVVGTVNNQLYYLVERSQKDVRVENLLQVGARSVLAVCLCVFVHTSLFCLQCTGRKQSLDVLETLAAIIIF